MYKMTVMEQYEHDRELLVWFVVGIAIIVFLIALSSFIPPEPVVKAGIIEDKEIRSATTYTNMDYQIIVRGEYEHNGKVKTTTTNISVDKETYLKAEIGKWFDSRTLEVTEVEKSNSNISN